MPALGAELKIEIGGITGPGDVHVHVFTSADGFPKEERAAIRSMHRLPAGETSLGVELTVPDAAEYAVMCFQDKDGNGKMNRLFGMIPQEPYGLSRNPNVLGKPRFEESSVKAGEIVRINLRD